MAEGDKQKSYTWSVGNIKELFKDERVTFESPVFSTEITLTTSETAAKNYTSKWRLSMKKGVDTIKDEGIESYPPPIKRRCIDSPSNQLTETVKLQYLELYLQNDDSDNLPPSSVLKITFSIVKPTVGKIYSKSKILLQIIKEQNFGISDFIRMDEFEKFNLQDLMILCEFEQVKKDMKSFESLLNNNTFSDIELYIEKKVLPGHKIVLALSSLVFRELFAKDDSLTRLEIKDTEPEVFDELLRFMYTGNVNNVDGLGVKLFEGVCRFEIWDFMTECEKVITCDLKVENIVPVLLLCFKHSKCGKINNFSNKSFFFVLKNLKSIVNLDAFKNLVQINPVLLTLTLRLLFKWLEPLQCIRKILPYPLISSDIVRCCCKQYEDLLNNKLYSDIHLQVGDQKYHAHKLILGTKSPFFSRIFQLDTKEIVSGTLEIENLEPQVFYQVLRFIYMNEFENEDDKLVVKIFMAADKFEINDLKLECESILEKKLTLENVKDTLLFADDHNAKRLKKACIFYFIDNLCLNESNDKRNEKRSLSWSYISKFKNSHPHLLLEILNKMAFNYDLVFRQKK